MSDHADVIREWIKKGVHDRWNGHHPACSTKETEGCDCYHRKYAPALAALDALVAERDEARDNERHMRNLHDWRAKGETEQRARAEAAEERAAALEAERDAHVCPRDTNGMHLDRLRERAKAAEERVASQERDEKTAIHMCLTDEGEWRSCPSSLCEALELHKELEIANTTLVRVVGQRENALFDGRKHSCSCLTTALKGTDCLVHGPRAWKSRAEAAEARVTELEETNDAIAEWLEESQAEVARLREALRSISETTWDGVDIHHGFAVAYELRLIAQAALAKEDTGISQGHMMDVKGEMGGYQG